MKQLAGRLLDLWQEQLTLMSGDPEYQALTRNWSSGLFGNMPAGNPPSTAAGGTAGENGHDNSSSPRPEQKDGSAPAAAASDDSAFLLRELSRSLEQLQKRIIRLEGDQPAPGAGIQGPET